MQHSLFEYVEYTFQDYQHNKRGRNTERSQFRPTAESRQVATPCLQLRGIFEWQHSDWQGVALLYTLQYVLFDFKVPSHMWNVRKTKCIQL